MSLYFRNLVSIMIAINSLSFNYAFLQSSPKFYIRSNHRLSLKNSDCSPVGLNEKDFSNTVISQLISMKFHIKISRAIVFSSLGIFLQNSLSNGIPYSYARESSYEQSTLLLSEAVTSTKVSLAKDAIKVPPSSKTTTTSNAKVTAAPKLAEEVALEGAVNKRNSGKARLESLNSEIKTNQVKLTTLKNDIKSLENTIKKIDSKLKKVEDLKDITTSAEFDDSQRKLLKELNSEKSLTQKAIGEKNVAIRSAQTAIERDNAEVASLNRRLKSDDEFVKEKQQSLKAKLDSIAKQKADLRAQEIQKEVKAALAVKEKIEQSVKKAVEESKNLKTGIEKLGAEEKKLSEQIKSAQQLKKAEEQALQKVSSELDALQKKQTDAATKQLELKSRLSASEKAVKDRLDAAEVANAEVRRVSSKK